MVEPTRSQNSSWHSLWDLRGTQAPQLRQSNNTLGVGEKSKIFKPCVKLVSHIFNSSVSCQEGNGSTRLFWLQESEWFQFAKTSLHCLYVLIVLFLHRPKTAFVTKSGLHELFVLHFGFSKSPSIFECCMETVLKGHLDDVIVHVKSIQEIALHLTQVLSGFKIASLKLKPSKCHYQRKQV